MKDVRIYDYEFNLLHIEPRFKSSNWTIHYNAVGNFELHIAPTSPLVRIAIENDYLVAVQGDLQAVIVAKRFETDSAVLYGRTVNFLLNNGVTPKFKETQKDCESIVREKIADTLPWITLGPTIGFATLRDFWRHVYHPTLDVVCDCLALENAGHRLVFDRKLLQWRFEILQGKEIPLILTRNNKNIYQPVYKIDTQNCYVGAYFERLFEDNGDWNASTNTPKLTNLTQANFGKKYTVTTAGTQFSISWNVGDICVCTDKGGAFSKHEKKDETSFWTYINRDESVTGIYKRDCVLQTQDFSQAEDTLSNRIIDRETKATSRILEVGIDYNLGDIVRVQQDFGNFKRTTRQRITGVELWYEENNVGQQPVLKEII